MKCEECDYTNDNKYSLRIHFLSNHEDLRIKCLVCHKKFKSIVHHFRTHKEEYAKYSIKKEHKYYELNETFKCNFCDFYGINIIRHLKESHETEFSNCSICDKKLNNRSLFSYAKLS